MMALAVTIGIMAKRVLLQIIKCFFFMFFVLFFSSAKLWFFHISDIM